MIGILAVIAMVGYRKYLHSAKTGEAKEIIGQIHVAEAAYKAETLGYLGCSSALATAGEWYPAGAAPDGRKWHWVNPNHGDFECWRMLNVVQDSPTYFGFAVVAGAAGNITAVPSTSTNPFSGKTSPEPWYVVQAVGNNDKDTTYSYFVSSSLAPSEIFAQDESE
jgi:type IV pilus assembly protein PilA